MKNLNLSLKVAILSLTALLTTMCGKTTVDGYANAIPEDVMGAVAVNISSIHKKADMAGIQNSTLYQSCIDGLEYNGMNPQQVNYLRSIVENPANSGIDTEKNAYFFAAKHQNDERYMGGVLKMGDKSKFEQLIGIIDYISNGELKRSNENGIDIAMIDNGDDSFIVAYNDSSIVLIQNEDTETIKNHAVKLLGQKTDGSLMANKEIAAKLNTDKDINMAVVIDEILDELQKLPGFLLSKQDVIVSNAFYSLNFEKGKIASDFSFTYKDKNTEKDAKKFYDINIGNMKGDLLKYIPEEHILTLGMSFNGSKAYEVLSASKEYSMIKMVPYVKQAMDAIYGDVAFSISATSELGLKANLLLTVKDTKIFEDIFDQFGSMMEETAPNQYSIQLDRKNTAYFGLKGKILYATTDLNVLSAINGDKIKSIDNKLFKNNEVAVSVDFGRLSKTLSEIDTYNYQRKELEFMNIFDYMELYGSDIVYIDTYMTDKNQNAAKSILDAVVH